MKQSLLLLVVTTIFLACSNSQSKAIEQAKKTQEILKANSPGYVSTSSTGYFMKAKINGKDWEATAMMPPEVPARIIGENNGESMSLPYDRRDMVVGEKTDFENSAVDLFLNDDVAIWGGHKGKMEITKVDGNWAEGKFFFTATSSGTDKKVEVTDGFFRISLAKNQ